MKQLQCIIGITKSIHVPGNCFTPHVKVHGHLVQVNVLSSPARLKVPRSTDRWGKRQDRRKDRDR
ncbi:hypothetical protein PAXRUDRAFT_821617 [Paxillus rubicundulus Ve08.2h10]|uniref:Uncharacterized protein n=1 Tax=Paxillus rubicundulus Ve08.2h10 TaxID=930991 RepID=A0A0D0DXZ6_9AGAM|nr:hypothetical protein PAXRUDRAFT_821617 [Paxillus rubicundulus Ve08.2h10]